MKRIILIFTALLLVCLTHAGTVDTLTLHSEVMNRDIEVIIVKPTVTKANRNRTYPVVYLLHGAYGNARSWLGIKPDLPTLSDELGMIFVTPSALNSWYLDSPKLKDYRYETFMTTDLITYIDNHYKTIPRREARAITGLSMGGHGALFLAMRHKNLYGACGSMSGGVDIRPFPLNWNLPDVLGEVAANKQEWDNHTVVNQLDSIRNHDLAITFDCGEADFFLEVNKSLHQRLLGRGIDHDFTTRPGAHNNEYWNNAIDYQLLFFRKYFQRNHILP